MSLDFPATGTALLAISDRDGIRPEYILPVLFSESGFSTTIKNAIKCVGINQACPPWVPAGYETWSASQQIAGGVGPSLHAVVSKFGPIRSATRAYQANFLPSTLATAKSLASVLAEKGSTRLIPGSQLTEAAVYHANPSLDANGDGAITVGDLAAKMRAALGAPAVQSAIAQTYALRPGDGPVADPVLGDDFGARGLVARNWKPAALVAALVASAGALAWLGYEEWKRPGLILPWRARTA